MVLVLANYIITIHKPTRKPWVFGRHAASEHIDFESGKQAQNPNRSIARYSPSKPIVIESLKTILALYDLIGQAKRNGEKMASTRHS